MKSSQTHSKKNLRGLPEIMKVKTKMTKWWFSAALICTLIMLKHLATHYITMWKKNSKILTVQNSEDSSQQLRTTGWFVLKLY